MSVGQIPHSLGRRVHDGSHVIYPSLQVAITYFKSPCSLGEGRCQYHGVRLPL